MLEKLQNKGLALFFVSFALRKLSRACQCFSRRARSGGDLKDAVSGEKTHSPRRLFHYRKLRCVMTVVSVALWHQGHRRRGPAADTGHSLLRQASPFSLVQISIIFPRHCSGTRETALNPNWSRFVLCLFMTLLHNSSFPRLFPRWPYDAKLKVSNCFEAICLFSRWVQQSRCVPRC